MANRTNASAAYYSYEYYMDYLDLIPVDEKKLKANKHSIVIAFWVSLAAFVLFLFLILLYMSWSGPSQTRNSTQRHPTCRWSLSLNLPLCVWRHCLCHRAPQGTRSLRPAWVRNQASEQPVLPSSSRSQRAPPPRPSPPPGPPPLSSGNWPSTRTRTASADIGNVPSEPPLQTQPPDRRTDWSCC
ncbi:LOW QUALITY PROTEIN: melanocortin-2 receptor accessory protein [Vicugna pacos]|uniref:LOW QUALITY PROTEIN: melanocortin-2 receptor accessory protein n=1 Tax=Vicugna pacos TaxID=30538 RepID=A0A6I9IQB6_VICPA|nr:LOW QUALITY PROTEIN: melanocortin-2 receptor accessory protein [Vicugna pacos]